EERTAAMAAGAVAAVATMAMPTAPPISARRHRDLGCSVMLTWILSILPPPEGGRHREWTTRSPPRRTRRSGRRAPLRGGRDVRAAPPPGHGGNGPTAGGSRAEFRQVDDASTRDYVLGTPATRWSSVRQRTI